MVKKYENRIVLFLDILGFKHHLNKTIGKENVDDEKEITKLYMSLLAIRAIAEPEDTNNSRIATQFSDAIVISIKEDDKNQVLYLLDDIASILITLIRHRIICRGAISYGKLIHTKDVVFGPALVDAYLTESEAAMYPRVILDQNIIKLGVNYDKFYEDKISAEKGLLSYLGKDEDDKYYIDYFEQSHYRLSIKELNDYVGILREMVLAGRRFKKPDLKVKYGWMKNKFNKMVDKYTSEIFLSYYKEDDRTELEKLSRLKKIP